MQDAVPEGLLISLILLFKQYFPFLSKIGSLTVLKYLIFCAENP